MRRLLLFVCLASLSYAQRRGMTAEDYLAFETANDPQLSPDGQWVAYTVTTIDQKANRRKSEIYITSTDGKPTGCHSPASPPPQAPHAGPPMEN